MDVIVSGRGGGKTHQLIEMSARDGFVIVTPNVALAEDVKRRAREMGLVIPEPVSWSQSQTRLRGSRIAGLGIDNLDLIIQSLAHHPVQVVTLTDESHGLVES